MDVPPAAPRRRVRFRQLSLAAQVKIVFALAVPTSAILFGLFILLDLAGYFRRPEGAGYGVVLTALAAVCALVAAALAAIQVAGLLLLRLIAWPNPALDMDEPRDPNLVEIFE